MDYFFLSSLSFTPRLRIPAFRPPQPQAPAPATAPRPQPAAPATLPKRVVACYDIVCQWAILLFTRILLYPPNVLSSRDDRPDMTFLVPKFHLNAHRPECRANFSLNFTPHVGRTDGEAPERGWAAVNAVANSTKEMGPGSRRDTLDDHFGDYNWRKIITMATMFRTKVQEAIAKREEHQDAYQAFHGALPAADTDQWLIMVEAWEKDRSNTNPFAAKVERISESAVRLELAEEDAVDLRESLTASIHDDVSPSRLIAQGLELEDHQRVLRRDMEELGPHSTDLQRSKVIERSNRLLRKIEAWMSIQVLYMPQVAPIRTRSEIQGGDEMPSAKNVDLLLPSSILSKGSFDTKFLDYEWRLRYAQAHAVLDEIRRLILLRTQMYKSKDKWIQGQRMHTRSLALLNRVSRRIDSGVEKYRDVCTALAKLSTHMGKVGWESELREIKDDDLRGLSSEEDDVSEGKRVISWIWKTNTGVDALDDEGKQEALRIEWCKARARAHRWEEECLLLKEEMRRVIAFHRHKQSFWEELATRTYSHVDAATATGLRSYAGRQVDIQRRLAGKCVVSWHGLSEQLGKEGAVIRDKGDA
ncbi:hypothetical protein H0H93_013170 [Arthromyces matolae]|nr:hypothetical protein H0H93_013170 [Arthromyces matolae]